MRPLNYLSSSHIFKSATPRVDNYSDGELKRITIGLSKPHLPFARHFFPTMLTQGVQKKTALLTPRRKSLTWPHELVLHQFSEQTTKFLSHSRHVKVKMQDKFISTQMCCVYK